MQKEKPRTAEARAVKRQRHSTCLATFQQMDITSTTYGPGYRTGHSFIREGGWEITAFEEETGSSRARGHESVERGELNGAETNLKKLQPRRMLRVSSIAHAPRVLFSSNKCSPENRLKSNMCSFGFAEIFSSHSCAKNL